MCLGVPGQILQIWEDPPLRFGAVSFAGTTRDVCLQVVPEAEVGQYVIVHAGMAIGLLDEHEAEQTLALIAEALDPSAAEP
jgi:hydrogenase expression/formation protein HypC